MWLKGGLGWEDGAERCVRWEDFKTKAGFMYVTRT